MSKAKETSKSAGVDVASLFQSVEEAKAKAVESLQAKRMELNEKKKSLTRELDSQLEEVEKYLEKLTGTSASAGRSSGTRRPKRPTEEIKRDAEKLFEFIHKNPGLRAKEIQERTGIPYGQSLTDFVMKYAGKRIVGEGSKTSMTYKAG